MVKIRFQRKCLSILMQQKLAVSIQIVKVKWSVTKRSKGKKTRKLIEFFPFPFFSSVPLKGTKIGYKFFKILFYQLNSLNCQIYFDVFASLRVSLQRQYL